ncbi:hypothetical protein QJS10_CPB20g00792 [Acorus calamus]|uniref:Uncharacterized protein n=1 Tax=Acorus calamus TaxID=4465 RepID=A0AAV9CCK7_ACOCL|nr:hypothetical protein QJS10_CPB20g00792 [Acorus calamus]
MSEVRRKRPCPSRRRRPSEDTIVEKIDGVLDKIAMSASSQAPILTNLENILIKVIARSYIKLSKIMGQSPGFESCEQPLHHLPRAHDETTSSVAVTKRCGESEADVLLELLPEEEEAE